MTDEFGALRKEMGGGFRSLHERADAHMNAIGDVKETVTRIEETLTNHTHRLGSIENKLDSTIERVDDHGVMVKKIEEARS